LFVVPTGDLENVTLEAVSNMDTINFMRNTFVVECTKLALIVYLDHLLASRCWIRNVKLHDREHREPFSAD